MDTTHEWMGCEEVNDYFVATCSCGWTYQHPNYGTTQDTFVNHWADHILSEKQAEVTKLSTRLDEISSKETAAVEELARVREESQELRQVVKEYRRGHIRDIDLNCFNADPDPEAKAPDYRCDICKAADALLAPKPLETNEGGE